MKGKKELILVSDRGIASYQLAEDMWKEGFRFIMPLRKNFSAINYLRKRDEVFSYQDRMIAYRENKVKIGDEEMNLYKSRAYIEKSIRRFKDGFGMEGTYMQSDEAMSGYFFVVI